MHPEMIHYNDQEFVIKRKAGRRRWSLVVHSFRKPELRVSQGAQTSELLRFLHQNDAWLKRALQRKISQPVLEPRFEEGESLPLLGNTRPWTWQWTPLKKTFLVVHEDRTEIYCPQNYWTDRHRLAPELIAQAFRSFAEKWIRSRVYFWCEDLYLVPDRIRLKSLRSRWGSLGKNPYGITTLNLNRKLILAPPEVIDSVVIHELCHLRHFNHSPAFWQEVGLYCPEHKAHTRWLQEHSHWFYKDWF